MIVSFHPCFEGDQNIICAGREPDINDLTSIKEADAVILPQGCRPSLYKMASENCARVFPNYEIRFKYPGKIRQIHLFREMKMPHPQTEIYLSLDEFLNSSSRLFQKIPFIFKFDWGGEGDNVFLVHNDKELQHVLQKTSEFERTGQYGFLIQEYIPSQNRDLRVVIIGQKFLSYWRIQKNTEEFCANLSKGAEIDKESDPDLQNKAIALAKKFCSQTGMNLAGFDFLFQNLGAHQDPLFLEINYFFGRTGLGGSEKFYELLNMEIQKWLKNHL